MRDAFGGAFMIKLFLVFIFIYIVFTAIALNYARAFKVKNKVIDYLEDNEIVDIKKLTAAEETKMVNYFEKELLGGLNYRVENISCNNGNEQNGEVVYCRNGIKITEYMPTSKQANKLGTYYRVETYFTWELSFLNILLRLNSSNANGEAARGIWTISGETRIIVKQ